MGLTAMNPGLYSSADEARGSGQNGLTRVLDDGRIELDTNIVERSMITMGRMNRKRRRYAILEKPAMAA